MTPPDRRIALRKELRTKDYDWLLKRYAKHAGKLLSELRYELPDDWSSRQFLIDMIVRYEAPYR